MHQMCLPKAEVEGGGNIKGKYGLNYDEQGKLPAEEVCRNRKQRLLQVREQEKEFARANRQAYEHRLSQERKRLYAELLQKWDRQQQGELQSLQLAYQKAVDEALAAKEQADQAAAAAQGAEAAAVARRALQADLAAKRSAEAAQQACLERDILARERDRRRAWLEQARNSEKTRAAQQVTKQQEAQRRAAEEARERLKRRGRKSVYDFRFTRFHETGLELQTVPDLPSDDPSLAGAAEMKEARRAEQVRAAEERGRAALHNARTERAARDLTAQLEAELQARRSAATAASLAPSNAALQPLRAMGTASVGMQMERHIPATYLSFEAAKPAPCQAAWHGTVAPNLAAMPYATWPQRGPWPAHRYPRDPSAEAHFPAASLPCQPAATWPTRQPADKHSIQTPHKCQSAAAAVGAMHEPMCRPATLADKTTQCPEAVDRQTQTESPEPDMLPASRVPRPYPLSAPGSLPTLCATGETAPAAGAYAACADTSLPAQHSPQQETARGTAPAYEGHGASSGSTPATKSIAGGHANAAHKSSATCNAQEAGAAAGQQGTGMNCSEEVPRAETMGMPTEDMVRTMPGKLSDSCCSSRAASVACLADLAPEAAAQQPTAAERPLCAAAPQRTPALQEASMAACNPADAACTIRITARGTTSEHKYPAANKNEGGPEKWGSAVVLPQERVCNSGELAAQRGGKDPLGPHMSGTNLAQATAELEALCAESLGLATPSPLGSAPSKAPQRSKPSMHEPKQTLKLPPQKPVEQVSLAKGRPVKTALQEAEELLARLTEEAAAWDNAACSAAARQPPPKEQQLGCQAKQEGQEMSSLEILAERLQDAISDTVGMTESMLTNHTVQPNLMSSKVLFNGDTSRGKSTSWRQPNPDSSKERSRAAERSADVLRQGQLGTTGSVASSSCSSLLAALRLPSIGDETSPDRDADLDADRADILSCSGDDAASDSDLPFDALSFGSTQLGTPLSGTNGGREDEWLSDIDSLDMEDCTA